MRTARNTLSVVLFSSALLAAGASHAATWQPIGPDGGAITALAEAPNGRTLYATSPNAGVFKSADGGRSWSRIPEPFPGVGPLAVDAVSSARLYVGSQSGLFRTADGGATWEHVNPQFQEVTQAPTSALLADPHRPGVAWIALDVLKRVYQTTDGGDTWSPRDRGLGGLRVNALAAHPRIAGRLYAATDDGIYSSRDGGGRWSRLGLRGKRTVNVAVDAGTQEVVHALAVEPINHYGITTDRLYLLSHATHGSFVREGGGTSVPGSGLYTRVAADPLLPGVTYAATAAGLFVQRSPGGAWNRLPQGPSGAVLPSRVRPGSLFALESPFGDAGLYLSRDGGATWTHSDHGLNAEFVRQIEPDAGNGQRLYSRVGCCQLWRSEDGGANWGRVAQNVPLIGFAQLLTDPVHPGTAFLATAFSVWKTEDGGDSWRELGIYPSTLALDPGGSGQPETLYGNDPIFPLLQRSRDGGTTWETLGQDGLSTNVMAVAQGGATPHDLYANGYSEADSGQALYRDRVRRSSDGGVTWSTLLVPVRGDTIFTAIADVTGSDSPQRRIYASFFEADRDFREAAGGIYRSTDGGATWTSLSFPFRLPVDTVAVDPRDSAHLFAGTPRRGVFESRDAGATWTSIADGLPAADVAHLTLDPRDPHRLFVSLLGGGAYLREEDR